ncbi:MAG: PDZ domain-containing protein [Gammaproteobacteria bacterium]|nr:PDZ domain-containing protein [Gammaproteobacteria bacterium]MDH3416449.1 PDZ domain-containing protein [Gammaproteobacteria bacterium]
MKTVKLIIPVALVLLLAGQAVAQTEEKEKQAELQKVQQREALVQTELKEKQVALQKVQEREALVQEKLEDAERQMAEAARTIAELTSERLPQLRQIERRIEIINDGRPRLGVTIGNRDNKGPVEGVSVMAVTPGSASDAAGIRAGDILTSINDESLSAASAQEATERLLDFMEGVEEGDTLDVEYLRDGKVGSVEVEPKPSDVNVFSFNGRPGGPSMRSMPHDLHIAPKIVQGLRNDFDFRWIGSSWGDMELVELNEGLGKYFGTDSGVLVVSAPESDVLKLEDGDVIQKIDGREPNSVSHALRILNSYQAGESLEIEVYRDQKRRKLEITMPDDRTSMFLRAPVEIKPARVPAAPRPAMIIEKT